MDMSHLPLPFQTNPGKFDCSVLRLPRQFKKTLNPPYECAGMPHFIMFQVNKKISLHGVGFLGPIDGDAEFQVYVQIKRFAESSWTFVSDPFEKTICARKGKIFYVLFDAPIEIEPNAYYDSTWGHAYDILMHLQLKGATKVPQFKKKHPKHEFVQSLGVKFYLDKGWSYCSPLAELIFKQN